jgi:hypothetical protein
MRGRCAAAGLVVAAVLVTGCGAEDHPNDPRPPAPEELSGKVDNHRVVVVPSSLDAGLVTITFSNQSADDVQIAFDGPTTAETDEIPAGGTGSVQFEAKTGEYAVEASVPTIRPSVMKIGAERPSAQNDLLLP